MCCAAVNAVSVLQFMCGFMISNKSLTYKVRIPLKAVHFLVKVEETTFILLYSRRNAKKQIKIQTVLLRDIN